MTDEQLRRGKQIDERIMSLMIAEQFLKTSEAVNIKIDCNRENFELSEVMKVTLRSLCIAERETLQKEFDAL